MTAKLPVTEHQAQALTTRKLWELYEAARAKDEDVLVQDLVARFLNDECGDAPAVMLEFAERGIEDTVRRMLRTDKYFVLSGQTWEDVQKRLQAIAAERDAHILNGRLLLEDQSRAMFHCDAVVTVTGRVRNKDLAPLRIVDAEDEELTLAILCESTATKSLRDGDMVKASGHFAQQAWMRPDACDPKAMRYSLMLVISCITVEVLEKMAA